MQNSKTVLFTYYKKIAQNLPKKLTFCISLYGSECLFEVATYVSAILPNSTEAYSECGNAPIV